MAELKLKYIRKDKKLREYSGFIIGIIVFAIALQLFGGL